MENVSWLSRTGTRVFATTRWSMVKACHDDDEVRAREALAELCQAYWHPVYACIRHHGHPPQDAEDLTQDFFVRLLSGKGFHNLDQAKGRFRAFLSVCLQNFLRDKWRRRLTWRRGRGATLISFDDENAELWYSRDAITHDTPESLYERRWALIIVENALAQLKIELAADNKEALWGHFDAILTANTRNFPYQDLARALNMNTGALHGALHRWRLRFKKLIREEISRTVLSKNDIDDELRHLLACVHSR